MADTEREAFEVWALNASGKFAWLRFIDARYVNIEAQALWEGWQARALASRPAEVDDWISVEDQLPEVGALVMVYSPPTQNDWPDSLCIEFDYLDPDADEPRWFHHGEHYEHFCCVAKPEGSIGPSEEAPYTHWRPVPARPSHTTNKEK
jgi:hypothetical protein